MVAVGAHPLAHSQRLDLARTGHAIFVFAYLQPHALAADGTLSLFHARVMLHPLSRLDNPQSRTYRTRVDAELLDSPS